MATRAGRMRGRKFLSKAYSGACGASCCWQYLLDVEDVPEYQRTPCILRGYRPTARDAWDMFRSIFTLHNETLNIWTHLLPAIYYLVDAAQCCLELVQDLQDRSNFNERAIALALIVTTDFMLIASCIHHTCKCGSRGVTGCLLKVDYVGIAALVGASGFAGISLGYRCNAFRTFYLLYLGIVVLLLLLPFVKKGLIKNQSRHFILCVSTGVVPAFHFVSIATSEELSIMRSALVGSWGYYGVGAVFFISHWPEARWPRRFDILGQSHQIWHICVLLGAKTWIDGMRQVLQEIGRVPCPAGGGAFS